MSKTSRILNNFRNKAYKIARTKKSLKLLTYFTNIGNIPLQGKIFPITFNETNILFYVPKNHLELAEAILHFEKSDTECKEIIKYYEKNQKGNLDYNNFTEKTGYHCGEWLIEYCKNNNLTLPKWFVHSANPVGSENIKKLLSSFNESSDFNLRPVF